MWERVYGLPERVIPDLPPNVLIVLLDDVGVDQVTPYGYPGAPPTPTIQTLADEGLRFDAAWATPVCSPTRAALLTGRFADRTHIGAVIMAKTAVELPLDVPTLPELLVQHDRSWSSAAIGKWHLATLESPHGAEHPLLQGFDWFAGSMNNIGVPPSAEPRDTKRSYYAWDRVGFDGEVHLETDFSTTRITSDAIVALTELTEPFLLYVAYHAAHRPLAVPPGATPVHPEDENELYALNVTAADQQIGRLLDALGERRERTVVMVIGDNGTPSHAKDAGGQVGTKGTFREGGLRVPFVVAGPGVVRSAASSALVSVADVVPTVLELAGAEPVETDGVSFAPVLADPTAGARTVLYSETRNPPDGPPWRKIDRAARDAGLKLVDLDGRRRLFRVEGFRETEVRPSDLTADERLRLRALQAELDRHPR